jgi:diguanylate cyclase (GGDEF)-like protein
VPVVVLSADEDEELAVQAVNEGAQDYLVKRHAHGPLLVRSIRYAIERKRAELELAHRATHDALTGLPNRALLRDRLELTLARVERRARGCGVLFLDLDGFKAVNDSFGHDVGDALLVAVGERLRALVRPSDTVARFGGDEFVVLCDDLLGPEEATKVADRIVTALADPLEVDGKEHVVGVSIGVALADGREEGADALIRRADEAMYAVKQDGGGWRM